MKALKCYDSRLYNHVFFSVMDPKTHIVKHHGPSNKKLRIHLPLIVPAKKSSSIRVGEERRIFEKGKCVVFDDSFEHEAWNDHPSQKRVCLIVDVWHPDLSDDEVKVFRFLEKAKMKRAKTVCLSQAETNEINQSTENFYSLIYNVREKLGNAALE
eukprot:CAMPEP_0184006888 /NCGR_PEP_ID=MMETSP0954-20121128/981_1 /TAXON_ID=627963 /ORGANISM="Aplanochytrium sp, Strain PBS07" /LENGTH=155 /DNA_ID=CAMNT_0026285563 /DNA_START=161 /DNA_END=628 /DNA_ORIENTATION=+